ncbi:NAD(P)H-dependent flavin oxidoreductase [Nocardia sp. NPDC050175]|uniref:NAD(P)H-dependent flavin oxidoreductase n=1 Tax=Nocardia sp. NPDC050175 TaxID=3364317 RepID=UPI003796B4E4
MATHTVEFTELTARLTVPLIAAPMFQVSGPELVIAACRAGVVGSFPTVNARTPEQLSQWLSEIDTALASGGGPRPAPVAANLIVHPGNARLLPDLRVLQEQPTEIVITSVGTPRDVVEPLHEVGSLVLADVASVHHAVRAVECGADGLILLTAGAGGQTGWANPFAFVRAVREFFDGPVVLAGGVSDGVALRAAITLGADLAYMGTKFLATAESMAAPAHKDLVAASSLDDVVLTSAFTGLPTNMLAGSMQSLGIDVAALRAGTFDTAAHFADSAAPKNWSDIWSAGHAASGVTEVLGVAELVDRTRREYTGA